MKAKPCVVCGTTGGYVPTGKDVPHRPRGACESCYRKYRRAGRIRELERERADLEGFMQRVLEGEIEPDDGGCILWPSNPGNDGYPILRINGERIRATHIVLEELVEPRPSPGHVAAHAPHEVCGNRHCVNVEHLRWATPAENVSDSIKDGTFARGEVNGRSKLTADQAREIRSTYEPNGDITQAELADKYDVSPHAIHGVVHNRTWTHLLPGGWA